ncbi:PREDICTED: disintegrin and metalloproteinase domain-containing protein 2-like [Elephantulus edwardii]|uniref:disintegrin and metalloproteinase domain-containing protein 2-like n=1 Tax=Elephantulus edwardii TaxID=28737 RepID=UPI0003F08104|nr:PREDICTED: disintegrin and metalloproteinase domain-containing protein 2-like [Elephantulus edwardii]
MAGIHPSTPTQVASSVCAPHPSVGSLQEARTPPSVGGRWGRTSPPRRTGAWREITNLSSLQSSVAYNIVIDGRTYILNLTQKTFLHHNFRVYGYQGAGSMKPLKQNFQNLCFYQGFIEGFKNSMVMVNTCTGLRGLLQFENTTYGIEPLDSAVGFEHMIYQAKPNNTGVSLYVEEVKSRDLPYKIQSVKPVEEFSQYIEMHIVVEKNLYDHMGSDTSIVTEKIFQLIGLTNAIFASLNTTVILSSLELWIDENKISTTGDANDILNRFLMWKKSYLVLRPHDVAFLLVYRENSAYVGATYQGKMCDRIYGGGVAMHPKIINLESLSIILAQLLSLSMGIPYDDKSNCHCPGAVCIMNPEAIHSSGMKSFSNCSMEDFAHFISKPNSQCLRNQPHLEPSFKSAICGNGIVEPGEQCDCGTEEECRRTPGHCCNFATCTFVGGANCATGECCEGCFFKSKGELCREPNNECDLPEFCNGTSSVCPEDFYIQNGHPCGGEQWICLEGKCLNGEKQCIDTFGDGVTFGSEECFKEINSLNDRTGNCGLHDTGYKPCLTKLQYITFYSKMLQVFFCFGQVCKDKQCVDMSYLNYDCDKKKHCNDRGVCNNKKHCHCNPGYLPPDCSTQDMSSLGGSLESGNFHISSRYSEIKYSPRPVKWPLFLLIPFFIILGLLIVILVKLNGQRKNWTADDYANDEQYESESELKEEPGQEETYDSKVSAK